MEEGIKNTPFSLGGVFTFVVLYAITKLSVRCVSLHNGSCNLRHASSEFI